MLILVGLLCLTLHAGNMQTVSITITESGGPLVAGQSYNLTCNVDDSDTTTSYAWNKVGFGTLAHTRTLAFSSLNLSDVGEYICIISNETANTTIQLAIPPPVSVLVISSDDNPIRPVGSNVTLTCDTELNSTVDIEVNVTIVWTGPNQNTIKNDTHTLMGNITTTLDSTITIGVSGRNESGDYTCNVSITALSGLYYAYLNDSEAMASNKTRITTGVYISLNESVITNNSHIIINRGNKDEYVSLICYTDNRNCCQTNQTGQWNVTLLNGNTININKHDKFKLNRNDDGIVNITFDTANFGEFCCRIPNADNIEETACINSVPSFSIEGGIPQIAENYTLNCSILSEVRNISFQWEKDNFMINETGSTLFFSPLTLSDAGLYTCAVFGHSMNKSITLTIPPPVSVNLTSNKLNPVRPIASEVILTCIVKLTVVESELSLLILETKLSRNRTPLTLTLTEPTVSGTTFTYTTQLNSFERSDSGDYTCTSTVKPGPNSTQLTTSISISNGIKISTGVYISLNNTPIVDLSTPISMIGEGEDEALLCFTDLYQFCTDCINNEPVGVWYFPNKSIIRTGMHGDTLYVNRSHGVVSLSHRNNVTIPAGSYCCEIEDSNQTSQTICVNIYDEDQLASLSTPAIGKETETVVPSAENGKEATINGVAVGGAVAGGLLLIVVGILLIILLICRLKAQNKHSLSSYHTSSGFLEAIDSTKLPPEQDISEDGKGECIELSELDEIQEDKGGKDHFKDMTPTADGERMKSILVSEFCSHVEQLHVDRDRLFETEYTRLSRLPKFCTSEAKISHNMSKNRFANILPYDCSRVKLTEIEEEQGSDYINANYLDGYNKPNAYIAAQGPLPNTVCDFWRMVWEKKLSTIAMLTRCFEGRPKCEEYWPVNVGESIQPGHNLTITLKAMLPFAEYSVRKMTVKCVQPSEECEGSSNTDSSNSLEVVQFHFTGWPDHGVPQNGVVLVNFIWRIRTIHPYSDPCPLLVHCSAGVGRTGAFIVLDSMLERMKEEDNLNIFEFLKQLRAQRVLMVQTQAQYNFIHDVLNELILTGNTEISAPNFRIIMNRLSKVIDGENGYSKQFKILDQVSPTPREFDCTQANMEFNAEKNRYPHTKPNDRHRVMLREEVGSGRDYINASFINGYRQRGTYIATQVPMENTVNDFWKMIWEYKSTTIVLLCKMTEEGEAYPDFLPESKGGCMVYGKVEVKFVSQQVTPDYVVKHLEISEVKGADTLDTMTVTLFHYLRWPKNGSPQRSASLLEVIELVNKKQMGSGNKAITVMCNDGVGRTGAFICIHTQMERMKTEGVVDFFQCIKSTRIHRAGLVPDVDQYVLCHTVVADYLNDFDAYANFKDLI